MSLGVKPTTYQSFKTILLSQTKNIKELNVHKSFEYPLITTFKYSTLATIL